MKGRQSNQLWGYPTQVHLPRAEHNRTARTIAIPTAPSKAPQAYNPMNKSPSLRARWRKVSLPNKLTVFCTFIIALATVWYAIVARQQWEAMTAQLDQIKSGSAQTDRLIAATKNLVTAAASQAESAAAQSGSMKDLAQRALAQATASNRLATEAKRSADISQAAMEAGIKATQLDQRAWVGLSEFATVGGAQSADGRTFSFQSVRIAVRNSGRTPAINLSVVLMQTMLPRGQAVGDYDTFTTEFNRRREEESAKLTADEIKRNPEMADRIRARDREHRALLSRAEHDLFPAGQVLAPGVTITQGTGSASYGVRGEPFTQNVVYILGKISYNDIFSGTQKHITKFCLMREFGTQFMSCPTGNHMD